MDKPAFDLSKIRQKLSQLRGSTFWRSLEEVAETKDFKEFLEHEYPHGAAEFDQPIDRREFLKLMGASILMSGLAGCKLPSLEKIVPYSKMPEEIIPGKPLFFATGMPFNGTTLGLLAESHMGRPTKVEGNPGHPDSLGATDIFAQASVLGLYDPDRSKVVLNAGRIRTWDSFLEALQKELELQDSKQGAGLRVLTETVTSPTLAFQLRSLLQKYPKAKWHQYDPVSRDHARKGAKMAFGEYGDLRYDFSKADVVFSLDADFFSRIPGSLRYARQFIDRRRDPETANLNRLYAVESTPTLAGSVADHRFAMRASSISFTAIQLAQALGLDTPAGIVSKAPKAPSWLAAAAEDLRAHRGSSLILAGEEQPPFVHALAHAMNQVLGNFGTTVQIIPTVEDYPLDQEASLRELVNDLKQGQVDLLVMLGTNPAYHAPADLDFAGALSKAGRSVHLGLYQDETAILSHWHVPETHYLEMFSDGRASDGTVTMIQPLIEPLYAGKSAHEIVSVLLEGRLKKGYDVVRDYWKSQWGEPVFESKWRRALHDGFVEGSAFQARGKSVKTSFAAEDFGDLPDPSMLGGFEVNFRPDPSIWDGRFANNGWLQELPKPMSTLTWDNAVMVSPRTAEEIGLETGGVLQFTRGSNVVLAPVWVSPGQSDGTLTLTLGYGRTHGGKIAEKIGFNAYTVRFSEASKEGFRIGKTGKTVALAATQLHHSMEGRNLVRAATQKEFAKDREFAQDHETGNTSMYPKYEYKDYAWGMVINLNACIGCNACMVACQSENNIPVVGKTQVLKGREMHWIRVDRYYEGSADDPKLHNQPVTCMHCENAPCEPVCPVGATTHSEEGLNEMVYNRCVGTRYCSNNCPYKVRRFNFLEYNDYHTETLKMMRNPDVTVRVRGVMEKCTYCVQRINEARITSKKENRKIRDGEIKTACQAACPTQAIVFGDINDKESQVAGLKKSPLNYGLLTELNTVPRTTYLAKVTNPNPAILEAGRVL
ncbi:MAG TPA: TAT-variant-translocated molybdopterin oxidoreductase [Verrucomicrobiae bacterium]|jgi:molybdopterin-containing oxidoreductase family iron-sulfur binding subunit|nr:TAT-variant-translocated molybdopterin oxidoreductase [Verrucomicrobiae bacterium]